MDLNKYNFTINPVGLAGAASRRYVGEVHEHLRWIHRTVSGRLLLNVIGRPGFPVEIRPFPAASNAALPADQRCNAVGGGENRGGALAGVVEYSPSAFFPGGPCTTAHGRNISGRIRDEILFHELVHVFRNATGKWKNGSSLSLGMQQYTNDEEFFAVLCTNIYISDRSNRYKSGLRAGHQGFGAMAPEDAMRFGLFASSAGAFGLVKRFCADHPIFSKALNEKLGDVEYNPVADFLRFPKICEVFAQFGAVKDRIRFRSALAAIGIPVRVVDRIIPLI